MAILVYMEILQQVESALRIVQLSAGVMYVSHKIYVRITFIVLMKTKRMDTRLEKATLPFFSSFYV